jgi:hypothetical protein
MKMSWLLLRSYYFVGDLFPPGLLYEKIDGEDHHAFWDRAFTEPGEVDNHTFLISDPTTTQLTPVGVDFYEMRRKNVQLGFKYDYGPFGVLIPLVDYKGAGFFHCLSAR